MQKHRETDSSKQPLVSPGWHQKEGLVFTQTVGGEQCFNIVMNQVG